MQPYPTYQNYAYGNNQYIPYQYGYSQQAMLNGQMVGSLDEVKAKDVDLSGNPTWYPKVDGTEVYRKQLQADGTSKIITYKVAVDNLQEQSKQTVNADMLNSLLTELKQDLMTEISEIKDMLPLQTDTPKTTKGGAQK